MRRYVLDIFSRGKVEFRWKALRIRESPADTWIVMLFEMCTDKRNKLQLDLYMPRTKSTTEGGSSDRVRELWLCRMCFE